MPAVASSPKIIFFCPPVSVINGGIKHTFRMAEALIELGHDAVVFEQNAQRPSWFNSTAPIVGQGIFSQNANHIYVLPEDQPHILADFRAFPQRKVIYCQNHFYGALGIGELSGYADYGITDLLCASQTILRHCRIRHPSLNSHLIPCAVDRAVFKPASIQQKMIAFMPRKRPIEAIYIRDMVRFSYPHMRDWVWREISNLSETEVAHCLGEAQVFLSLSRLEGFGLTPLEAMAAGCIVAGFTGIGGREYAHEQNGFWAGDDDLDTCVQQLERAVSLSLLPGASKTYADAAAATLAAYTPETFKFAVADAWKGLLS